jgi:hypothetical protein
MNVHGGDGIHVRYERTDAILSCFIGESKGYSEVAHAMDDAISSIINVRQPEQVERELEILHDHIDVPIGSPLYEALLTYLNPYQRNNARREVNAMLIGFSWPFYKSLAKLSPELVMPKFLAAYQRRAEAAIKLLDHKLRTRNLDTANLNVMFLPVPSFSVLRAEFHRIIEYR